MNKKGKVYVIGLDQMILPLTRHFAEEGSIPTIAKLLERSAVNKALASYPSYTANNWPVIATGANTGTHGAFGWFIHMPDGQDVSSLFSLGINAEFIWEAAERQGLKSAVVHYPGSSPSRLKEGYVVEGFATPAYAASPFELAAAEAYTTHLEVESTAVQEVAVKAAEGWQGLPSGGPQPLETAIPVTAKKKEESQTWQVAILGGANGYDRVVVCREKDFGAKVAECKLNEWSDWSTQDIGYRQGTVRFKLTDLSADGKNLKLFRSQIMPLSGFSEPDDIGRELIEKIGPYQEHVSQMFASLGMVDYKTCVEEADYQAQWIAKAALYLTKEKGCDMFFSHWHFLDDINHWHLAYLDPKWVRYDEKETPHHWNAIRQAYQAVDRMMATLLEGVTEDDYVIMISDHGCSPINRVVFMEKFLFDKGFLVFKDPKTPKTTIAENWYDKLDWDKTKVWLHEGVFLDTFNIYINAEKDTPKYDEIQRDLIRELRTWVDDKMKQTVVAFAFSKRDAELVGLWGDQVGDVVVALEGGYQMGRKDSPTSVTDNTGHVASGHGRMISTFEGNVGTEKAIFVLSGPGIKQGYERPADKLGHIKLVDVTPTLCHILGIQPPAQSQGAVAYDLLEGHEMVRERPTPTPYVEGMSDYKRWFLEHFFHKGLLAEESIPC
ncbi:MAG: alkaline phosphatase family protein [Chloroflexota bacterium]